MPELDIFHFRCNLCGGRPGSTPLREYLTAWTTPEQAHVEFLLGTIGGALHELTPGWITKKARRAINRTLGLIANIVPVSPSHLEDHDGALFFTATCPMCYLPSGPRQPDEYLHAWKDACRVQAGNLLYETNLILWTITASVPAWANATLLRTFHDLRTSLRGIAESMRLPECPQCGRWTTALFGDPYGPKEQHFCRWCLDAGGGTATRLSIRVLDGRAVVSLVKADPFAPARDARDLFPN